MSIFKVADEIYSLNNRIEELESLKEELTNLKNSENYRIYNLFLNKGFSLTGNDIIYYNLSNKDINNIIFNKFKDYFNIVKNFLFLENTVSKKDEGNLYFQQYLYSNQHFKIKLEDVLDIDFLNEINLLEDHKMLSKSSFRLKFNLINFNLFNVVNNSMRVYIIDGKSINYNSLLFNTSNYGLSYHFLKEMLKLSSSATTLDQAIFSCILKYKDSHKSVYDKMIDIISGSVDSIAIIDYKDAKIPSIFEKIELLE